MQLLILLASLASMVGLIATTLHAQAASGDEGMPLRRQEWRIPSPDTGMSAQSLLFRPTGPGPFRLAVIAHASSQNVLRRAQMPQPEYRALVALLVASGFAVVVPERFGHGATGGPYLEDQGGCDEADYLRAGRATAAQILGALDDLRRQDFIRRDGAIVVGHSAGGWGALALAKADPQTISRIIVFAPGRGGHANDEPNRICAPQSLRTAATAFGNAAGIPVTWIVAANDSYFRPDVSRTLADAFRRGGGQVDFHILPAVGSEGHWAIETEAGVRAAADILRDVLNAAAPRARKKQ